MPRTILVTEGDTPLGAALVRLLAARGYAVAVASARPSHAGSPGAPARSPLMLEWNRRSPVSARTVVLSTMNAFETLDEAVLLEPGARSGSALHESASADIERAFDDAKGPVFLSRELLSLFAARGGGIVSFVSGGPATGALESAVREAFRGLASAILASPGFDSVVANGFQCDGFEPEDYAAFIDRTLEEKARKITGRWFSCPQRGGFLQGVLRTSSRP